MRIVIGAAFLLVLTITGCGSDGVSAAPAATTTVTATVTVTPPVPDFTACRTAIGENYSTGWEKVGNDPWPPAAREPICSGIDRPTLQRLMQEAIDDTMNGTAGPG